MERQELTARVTRLEEDSVFRDQLLDELNRVVCRQADFIDQLQADIRLLKMQWLEAVPSRNLTSEEDSPPPHY